MFTHGVLPHELSDGILGTETTRHVTTRNKSVTFDFLDSRGQEEFRCLQDEWIRAAHVYILVYSITNYRSFEKLKYHKQRILRTKDVDDPTPHIMIIGYNSDLNHS